MNEIHTEKERLAKGLSILLADTYTLYLKTQNYHWNVKGPQFFQLHEFFEKQYKAMEPAIDEIAERIQALGFITPATFKEFLGLSTIDEDIKVIDAREMVQALTRDHMTIVNKLNEMISLSESAQDHATVELLGSRIKSHENDVWMLKSIMQ